MSGPQYKQTIINKIVMRNVKKEGDNPLKSLARWPLQNQIGFMEHALAPLGKQWGSSTKKDTTRFAEQGWTLIYYNVFWPLGIYIYYTSPYFLNLQELWTDWPQREVDGLPKAYMLIQWSFYLHLVLVLNIEHRRKDHWQVLTHHVVTTALIAASYTYHQTCVAQVLLMLMDVIDLIFPLAKCLKYLGFATLCDIVFGVFIFAWFLTRHVFYLMICWSVYSDPPNMITPGCYKDTADNLQGPFPVPNDWSHLLSPFWNPAGVICWNDNIMLGFLSCLLFLQGIMISWFFMIARVALRVLKGNSAEDVRSDEGEENGGDEKSESEHEEAQPYEEEVGAESLDLKGWRDRTGVNRGRISSYVRVPRHSAVKELLNRVGCEKKID